MLVKGPMVGGVYGRLAVAVSKSGGGRVDCWRSVWEKGPFERRQAPPALHQNRS